MAQKNLEMEKWKKNLLKADEELLLFDDMEELLHSAHADRLYNAKFPYNVANESRAPGNVFKLWLSDNMLVNTYNRSTKVQKADGKERHAAVAILEYIAPNGDDDTALSVAAQVVDNKQLTIARGDASLAGSSFDLSDPLRHLSSTKFSFHLIDPSKAANKYFAEQQQLTRNCHNNTSARPSIDENNGVLGNHTSPVVCTASLAAEINLPRIMEEANSIKQNEDPKTKKEQTSERVEKLDDCDDETIDIEKEADLMRDQRWIQGDEDLLMPISEQANAFVNQEQHKARKNEDTFDALITSSYRKKVGSKLCPWQKNGGSRF